MPLSPNSKLGPYEIKSVLGVGGMGEVYRARDTRLNRDVAIKVLRQASSSGSSSSSFDLRSRFEREARAVAALNHPNIIAVYDFGIEPSESGAQQYIVSELLDGESLRALLPGAPLKSKPLPVRKLIDIAAQIADGLSAAHAAGIVHRDLKPENIMLTKDGRAKILDFGLARHTPATTPAIPPGSDETFVPPSQNLTSAGAVLGTAAYMSPEQALGKDTDHRADQFSLGLILYEMASGRQAFSKPSSVETMAAIVREEPPPIEEKLPAPLKWIIDRCLSKEPEQRYESTKDLYRDLTNIRDHFSDVLSSSEAPVRVAGKTWTVARKWLVAGAAGGLFAGALVSYFLKPSGEDLGTYRYTPMANDADAAVWSPDGNALAYSGKVSGTGQVFLRYLNSSAPIQLTHGVKGVSPLGWSSDKAHLIIAEPARPQSDAVPDVAIYSVAIVGGDPDLVMNVRCLVCAVSPDGKALAALVKPADGPYGIAISDPIGSPLRRYTPEPFASVELYENPSLVFSPDGKSILFCRRGPKALNEMWRLPYPANSGTPERLLINQQAILQGAYGSWMPDNKHLVISSAIDGFMWHLAFAYPGSSRLQPLTEGTASEYQPNPSPNGQSIVFAQEASRGEVITASLQDGSTKALMSTSFVETGPTWSANGGKFAWISYRSGEPELWGRLADGSERPVVTAADLSSRSVFFMEPSFSRDGGRLLYPVWNGVGLWQWMTSLSGASPIRLTNTSQAFEYGGSWSPDGSRFAYLKNENGSLAVMTVKTTGNATPTTLVADIGSGLPDWSPTGEWITYLGPKGWTLISPDGKTTKVLGQIETPYLAFSKDGKLLYGILTGESVAGTDRATLFSLDLQTGKRKIIKELGKDFVPSAPFNPVQFSLTPDGKGISYSTYKKRTDLWMLTGYRQPGFWNQIKETLHLN